MLAKDGAVVMRVEDSDQFVPADEDEDEGGGDGGGGGDLDPSFLSHLVVGQRQRPLRHSVVSFSGEVTELRVWRRELSERELEDMSDPTNCGGGRADGEERGGGKGVKEGLLLDWEEQRWEHSQVIVRRLPRDSPAFPCGRAARSPSPLSRLVSFPEQRTFRSAAHLCSVLGGGVAIPGDERDNRRLHHLIKANFSVRIIFPSV